MADGDRFDPRFDPAFQRGFDPAADLRPAPESAPPPSRPAVELPRRPGDARPEHPLAETTDDRGDGRLDDRAARRHPDDDGDAAARRRNPYSIAALAIAVLLIVAGAVLLSRLPTWQVQVQGDTVVDYATLQVLYVATPLLMALGVATILALLLIAAARWRGPRSTDD